MKHINKQENILRASEWKNTMKTPGEDMQDRVNQIRWVILTVGITEE